MPATPAPLHIVSLEIENVKRLTAVHIKPDGSTIVIGGDNAAGKSSVLDAIEMALAGAKCARPVHGDESKGKVVVDLGEFVVTRTFTAAGGGTLTVAAANGAKFSSPQTMLDAMLGKISFDPLAFTRMKPADQLTTLRELCGINTAMLDAGRDRAFEDRTIVNRKVNEMKAQLAGMPHHADAPAEPVSAAEITSELKAANAKNEEREAFIREGRQIAAQLTEFQSSAAKKETEITEIEAELTAAKATLADIRQNITHSERDLIERQEKATTMTEIDTATISAQLDNIGAINAQVQANVLRGDCADALKEWQSKSEALTARITDFDARKRAKLDEAKYPVPGLALDDDGIQFNGLPFTQASSAEQLRVSVGIGLAMNPRLRVLLVRDGSLLDPQSLEMLREMAEEAQSQVFIEKVSTGAECSIIISDGKVLEDRTK